jgi:hypothetical protein
MGPYEYKSYIRQGNIYIKAVDFMFVIWEYLHLKRDQIYGFV